MNLNRASGRFSNTTSPFSPTSTAACSLPEVGAAAALTGCAGGADGGLGLLDLLIAGFGFGCAGGEEGAGAASFFAKSGFGGITSGVGLGGGAATGAAG